MTISMEVFKKMDKQMKWMVERIKTIVSVCVVCCCMLLCLTVCDLVQELEKKMFAPVSKWVWQVFACYHCI